MSINTTNFELPKYFYEVIVTYSSEKNLKNFNIDLEKLDISTINDLAKFSYVSEENKTKEKAIFCLNSNSINYLKLLFLKSEFTLNIKVSEITEKILNGEYHNENFWFNIENVHDDDILSDDERDFFLKYIQENSTLDNVLSKLYKKGMENLLKPEVEILNLVSTC